MRVYHCMRHCIRCMRIYSVWKFANAGLRHFYAFENFCDFKSLVFKLLNEVHEVDLVVSPVAKPVWLFLSTSISLKCFPGRPGSFCWEGGAQLAASQEGQTYRVSRKEYEEHGHSLCHKRFQAEAVLWVCPTGLFFPPRNWNRVVHSSPDRLKQCLLLLSPSHHAQSCVGSSQGQAPLKKSQFEFGCVKGGQDMMVWMSHTSSRRLSFFFCKYANCDPGKKCTMMMVFLFAGHHLSTCT